MGSFVRWKMDRVIDMIALTLLNKFDCFIVIEGKRGLGKSTLAYHLSRRVSRRMKTLREHKEYKSWYRFLPKRDILYSREKVIDFFNKWHMIGIGDEMINVTFNRDFYAEDQKTLIKIINMNRDHQNLFIACVPQFQTLDTQIKNLTKIRLTVVRRGFALIHTPNKTIYGRDIWDTITNEKIEREWLKKGTRNPHYARLTTCRGFLNFPDLPEKSRLIYEGIKKDERNLLMQEREDEKKKKKEDPFEKVYGMLIDGKIKDKSVLDGMAIAQDLEPEAIKRKLVRQLKKEGKETALGSYFSSKKGRTEVAETRIQKIFAKTS